MLFIDNSPAVKLYCALNQLCQSQQLIGAIDVNIAGITARVNRADTVGATIQTWLKQYLLVKQIAFNEPYNTQKFPDFYLLDDNNGQTMLEVKAFRYHNTPAFDIADFYSYCESLCLAPYRLNAYYLIFGYELLDNGIIVIKDLWLHKIWEIAGTSAQFPLKTQVKRNRIYNIRPNTSFKMRQQAPFPNVEAFIYAIYGTIKADKNAEINADEWLKRFRLECSKHSMEIKI